MVFLATVDPSPRPQPMKFPVFSQLAGELVSNDLTLETFLHRFFVYASAGMITV